MFVAPTKRRVTSYPKGKSQRGFAPGKSSLMPLLTSHHLSSLSPASKMHTSAGQVGPTRWQPNATFRFQGRLLHSFFSFRSFHVIISHRRPLHPTAQPTVVVQPIFIRRQASSQGCGIGPFTLRNLDFNNPLACDNETTRMQRPMPPDFERRVAYDVLRPRAKLRQRRPLDESVRALKTAVVALSLVDCRLSSSSLSLATLPPFFASFCFLSLLKNISTHTNSQKMRK